MLNRNIIKMFIRKNVLQLVVTFFVGAIIAGSSFWLAAISKDGKGGFESPAMPLYSENSSQEDQAENAELLATMEAAESADASLKPLTYMTYRLKPGDEISALAVRFDITSDTLISVNNIRASRYIQVGQYIKIPSEEGILYNIKKDGETPASIAEKYDGVDAVRCAFVNNLSLDSKLKAGESIFVPGAQMDSLTRAEINGDLFRRPIHARYRLTSYFGWRPSPFTGRRSWHGGLDMACPAWTPIYAAMDGRVVDIGYNNTYGNYVIINHYAGYKTLYGHMVVRSTDVKIGQYVNTATIIGRVGSTGASTGNHVHFTVFKNGRMINPIGLLGR